MSDMGAWLDARITEEGKARIERFFAEAPEPDPAWGTYMDRPDECPNGPHRPPEGPCEDIGQCQLCLSMSFSMRPPGECYGEHAPDCSLPERHESYCVGGGQGHSKAEVLRGYPEFTWYSIDPLESE